MTEFMGLAEKVSKFNQEALKHIERQTLNPFSGRFSRSPSPRPKFNKDEYGKPAAGSKTEMRGQRAFTQISREILELCEVIHDMGTRRRDSDGDECIIIPFGELFAFYTKISDKVVGLLIAAKKRGFVWFEPEILFQRRDDDVLIALLKPIGEIRNVINRQISASPSPAPGVSSETDKVSPCPTPSPLAQQESAAPSKESSPVDQEKPLPSSTPASLETESSSSKIENEPQQIPSNNKPVETEETSAPVSLLPVEEDKSSTSDSSVVEPKPEPTSIVIAEAEKIASPDAIEVPQVENKESTLTNESILPAEGDQNTLPTVVTGTEPISQPTESIVPTEEGKTSTEAVPVSEDPSSLTIKIIVEVEPDQIPLPPSEQVAPPAEAEQTPVSSEVTSSAVEETSSTTLQTAPDDNEQSTSSSATTTEPEHILPSSNKSEEVAPSTEQVETPPSNDTGEKTLA